MIPILLLLLTIIYVSVSAYKLKAIPESLSATYYLWPSWVFPFFMATSGIILLPYWLEATKDSNWQFLSFISCISFIFVGCAPNYRKDDLKAVFFIIVFAICPIGKKYNANFTAHCHYIMR